MVVAYHAVLAGHGAAAAARAVNLSGGVDLFFVISGCVMVQANPDTPPARFLADRLRRIVPLYWLLTLAKLLAVWAAPGSTPDTAPTTWNVIASLLFIPSRDATGAVRPVLPVGWTLDFEMLFYALFALALARRWPRSFLLMPLILLAEAGFMRTADWPAPLQLANGMVLEFAFGMMIGLGAARCRRMRTRWAWAVLVAGGLLLLTMPPAGPWRFLAWGLPASGVLAAALALEPEARRLPRIAAALGDASYAIYLTHPFVLAALHAARLSPPILLLSALPLSALCGWLVHRHIDRPMQRALRPRPARRPLSIAAGTPR